MITNSHAPKPKFTLIIINLVWFQIGWWVCILGGNLWAITFTVVTLLLHFLFFPYRIRDAIAVITAVALGLAHDGFMAWLGVLVFPTQGLLSPPWLWCVWILMALTFNYSLHWIYHRPLLAALGGAIFGPMAYASGIYLSTVEWGMPIPQGLSILVIAWLFVLPWHRYLTHQVGNLCAQKRSP